MMAFDSVDPSSSTLQNGMMGHINFKGRPQVTGNIQEPAPIHRNSHLKNKHPKSTTPEYDGSLGKSKKVWGRSKDVSWIKAMSCLTIMIFCPVLVIYSWMSCTHFQCSIVGPVIEFQRAQEKSLMEFATKFMPIPSFNGIYIYIGWLAFQAMLYLVLPGEIGRGQQTPAGHVLKYKLNGLLAWVVTHALFIIGSIYFRVFSLSIIHDHWGALLFAANIYGYALTLLAFIKAHISPTHPGDCKFSGSLIYDLYFGIEFNPRLGKFFDFKLFHNGRPGIIAWTLVDLSFAATQYLSLGRVTNSMVLVCGLHTLYVVDFFINENWYLRTIDIAHDHFGFYLSWGDTVWLPFIYTLQTHFLLRHTVDLSWFFLAAVSGIGLLGYSLFRIVNNQKDIARSTNGDCMIWGEKAKIIRTKFQTTDGKEHKSLLLISGYWGLARHVNYLGDLMLSLSLCLACGFTHILPYTYFFFMTWLLLNRIVRDHARCQGKYGHYWKKYCELVPYKLIPFVW